MPDRDDMPEPMDEAYRRAEQALDEEAARMARRAQVLAAVANEAAAPESIPARRRQFGRYGGWLAAAGVAGLSVLTASQVYRLAPRRQQIAPPTLEPSAPMAKAPAPLAARPSSLPAAAPGRPSSPPPPAMAARRAAPSAEPVAPPPADVAPPPPLPIPPVEKPIQAPPPAPIAGLSANAPPPPPAPVSAAKAGAAEPAPNTTAQSVVVTGSRAERRDYAASPPAISKPLAETADAQSKVLEARSKALGARLRYDAGAGRIADIESTLAQGALVDAADENGETALMKSVQTGQSEAAALLRRHGASLDLKNRTGVSARDMAMAKNDPNLNRALGLTR